MKFHIVLLGSLHSMQRQAKELMYVTEKFCTGMEAGEVIVFYEQGIDEEELRKLIFLSKGTVIKIPWYHPESIIKHCNSIFNQDDIYLFPEGFAGNEISVRIADRMQGTSLTSVFEIKEEGEGILAKKMVYASYLSGEFLMKKGPFCISIAKGLGESSVMEVPTAIIEKAEIIMEADYILEREIKKKEEEVSIADAKFLFVAGRGIKNKGQVKRLEQLAKNFQAEFGVSRPVAMNAWAPLDRMIGVSGTMAGPKLCVVFGASGAPAFYAGIEKSECIVAINSDEQASIIKKADEVILGDVAEVLEVLEDIIEREGIEDD